MSLKPLRSILGLPALTNDVRIFPNPASTHLYIEGIAQETVLTIHTFSGALLLRNFLTQESSVDLRSIPEGAYILTLKGSQGVRRQRLIKNAGTNKLTYPIKRRKRRERGERGREEVREEGLKRA